MATETWQKIRNSETQDGGRTPYWKPSLAITRLHIVRLRRNLEFGGIIARKRRLDYENVKFRKCNMADDRLFDNHYISISQPQIVRISRNLVCRHKIYHRRRKRQKKSEIGKFKMADGRRIENHFLAVIQLHVVPLRWNLEWRGRIIHADEAGQVIKCLITKIQNSGRQHFQKCWRICIWAANRPKLTKYGT